METYGTPNTPTEVSTNGTTPDCARCAVAAGSLRGRVAAMLSNAQHKATHNRALHRTQNSMGLGTSGAYHEGKADAYAMMASELETLLRDGAPESERQPGENTRHEPMRSPQP